MSASDENNIAAQRDFCVFCGARIPPIDGESTCERCDPELRLSQVQARLESEIAATLQPYVGQEVSEALWARLNDLLVNKLAELAPDVAWLSGEALRAAGMLNVCPDAVYPFIARFELDPAEQQSAARVSGRITLRPLQPDDIQELPK